MIEVQSLSIQAGAFQLENVSFMIPEGHYGVLMGKTGCGKTTLLEAVCGLKKVKSGIVRLMKRDVTQLKPAVRGIGFVPQDGALFSTMTVREHLCFALQIRKWKRPEIEERVQELADWLAIETLLDRRPQGLSGGERQRVALGRALSFRPKVLCLDEPLSALDDETKDEIYDLLKSLRDIHGITALHITHSREEARILADQVLLLRNGQIKDGSSYCSSEVDLSYEKEYVS